MHYKDHCALKGKTLVCKEKAVQKAAENGEKKVYYISLLHSSSRGWPKIGRPVFDVCTKEYDFNDTDVVPIDICDLWSDYKKDKTYNGRDKVTVYELALRFIKNNPNGHYIFDEVPIIKGNN